MEPGKNTTFKTRFSNGHKALKLISSNQIVDAGLLSAFETE